MDPKTPVPERDFFRHSLHEQINRKHPLVWLADLINWDRLGVTMSGSFVSLKGQPASSPCLITGPLYLQLPPAMHQTSRGFNGKDCSYIHS